MKDVLFKTRTTPKTECKLSILYNRNVLRRLKKQRSSKYGKLFILHQHRVAQYFFDFWFCGIFPDLLQHLTRCECGSVIKKLIVFLRVRLAVALWNAHCSTGLMFPDILQPYQGKLFHLCDSLRYFVASSEYRCSIWSLLSDRLSLDSDYTWLIFTREKISRNLGFDD